MMLARDVPAAETFVIEMSLEDRTTYGGRRLGSILPSNA